MSKNCQLLDIWEISVVKTHIVILSSVIFTFVCFNLIDKYDDDHKKLPFGHFKLDLLNFEGIILFKKLPLGNFQFDLLYFDGIILSLLPLPFPHLLLIHLLLLSVHQLKPLCPENEVNLATNKQTNIHPLGQTLKLFVGGPNPLS